MADPFVPYTGELGNLRPKGMLMVVILSFVIFIFDCSRLNSSAFFFFFLGVRQPHLSRFYIEQVQKARLYTDRTFHSSLSLQHLATWGLGPKPSAEAIAHELTVRRRKFFFLSSFSFFISLLFYFILFFSF